MYTYTLRLPLPCTEFVIDEDIFLSNKLLEICGERRVAILVDEAIAKTAGEKLKQCLKGDLLVVKGGDSCNTRQSKQELEDTLIKLKFGKDTVIIGMGGEALTDLVGFIASTFMHGVPLILIPTTLLGMVDTAIGGKNGIHTPRGKHLIGTIYHPTAVFIDLQFLAMLSKEAWQSGLAEILKHGLICDPVIWKLCEKHTAPAWQHPHNLKELIRASIAAKMYVLSEDPEGKAMGSILNFGHTVAQALKTITKFKMSHGEAVAIGAMAESWLSSHFGQLPKKAHERIMDLYRKCGFSIKMPKEFVRDKFIEILQKNHSPRFSLIERIGHTIPLDGSFASTIEESDFVALADWMEKAALL